MFRFSRLFEWSIGHVLDHRDRPMAAAAMIAETQAMNRPVRITVVYNNVPHSPGLATAWGFASVIETGSGAVLFDTGGDGPTLLSNLQRLGIDPTSIEAGVLSHIHGDHTGGLDGFLARHSNVTVYMPLCFPVTFRRMIEQHGARVEPVSGPLRLFENLHSPARWVKASKSRR